MHIDSRRDETSLYTLYQFFFDDQIELMRGYIEESWGPIYKLVMLLFQFLHIFWIIIKKAMTNFVLYI